MDIFGTCPVFGGGGGRWKAPDQQQHQIHQQLQQLPTSGHQDALHLHGLAGEAHLFVDLRQACRAPGGQHRPFGPFGIIWDNLGLL